MRCMAGWTAKSEGTAGMGTFGEAHELEHGNAGLGKQLAGLSMTGGAVQLHLDNPVLDRCLSHKGALEVVAQDPIRICMLQAAGVLLAAQGHLDITPPS